jgi:hypothetical protein
MEGNSELSEEEVDKLVFWAKVEGPKPVHSSLQGTFFGGDNCLC